MNAPLRFDFRKDDRIGGMTVVAPVVRGGNGDLYLVRDGTGRQLVLKVIRKPDNDCELTGIEKCRAVTSHISGLVPILNVGKLDDGRIWCVMPPADNLAQWPDYEPDTLAARIAKNGRLPPDEVLKITEKVLTILGELHEAGLAHCDVKPENILFLDGEPRLADYSLLSDTLNRPVDPPFGTVGFIPPEMLACPDAFDPKACDLYAAGRTLYCAWSGMEAMLFPSVPKEIPLREIGVMLPVYMKACSGSPNRRFRSAAEFLAALDDARARLHGHAPARRKGAFGKRLPVVLAALFAALCLTAAFFLFPRPRPAAPEKPDPLVVTTVLDVADENDGAVSFSEALAYAQAPGGTRTIRFNLKDGDEIVLRDPAQVTSRMRFAPTNEATGNPVNIVLDNLEISGREKSTPEATEIDGGGAVLRATSGRFSVRGGRFTENRDLGAGGRGGAIRIMDGSLTVDGADFRNNAAFSSGGAICVERTRTTIRDSSFTGNGGVGFGGAILLWNCPEVRIVNTEFIGNKTESNPYYRWSGGAIKAESSSLIYEVSGGTIINEGNESGSGGFLSLSVTKTELPKTASAEFRVEADGMLLIGDGNGMDSFASTVGKKHTLLRDLHPQDRKGDHVDQCARQRL